VRLECTFLPLAPSIDGRQTRIFRPACRHRAEFSSKARGTVITTAMEFHLGDNMPEMSSTHSVKSLNHRFTRAELARALRLAIADEYEAIQIYEQIAESTEDEEIREVIMHIVEEEQKHADQFWDLLARVIPEEREIYDSAVEENKAIIQRIRS
jgi:hypothetical protein